MMERALPMIKGQPGCIDVVALSSENDRSGIISIGFCRGKEDADKHLGGPAQQILQAMKPLLQGKPNFRSFNVGVSMAHDLGTGLAATS
jgi:hypothetical protein